MDEKLLIKKSKQKRLIKEDIHGMLFSLPYILAFIAFIVIPVFMGMLLSFTYFNLLEPASFIGLSNYITLLTSDDAFMQQVIPNTIKFAFFVGPVGYLLGFFLAWLLAQIPHKLRTVLALVIYSPSMTAGVAMSVMWKIIFSGDESGYLNSFLLNLNLIDTPIQWLTNPDYLMTIMIIVTIWSSMGIGFLAMLAGVLNINQELYEAAYVDGMSNKFQEIFYITIPSMKPQMLFGAVMSLVGTFNAGAIGVQLSGQNPTPQNAGQLIVTHIDDFGFIRYDMGYAAAISVVLLIMVYVFSRVAHKLFGEKE
ncbi:putative sugar ABC transporter, membrane component [Paracholeplasma brassicae]|uniref:Putative sugar ABC transporter, membrane component n=2 Tax=Acholeplasma brassicae TaxID=61635 RepID=U4KMT1_9MOLU|nr:sugar ABC transporter permease [Paracholeplasma brassicae]CCV65480.1 putative sugar ABC transporter, membrane component [Paracholeplasma brassicae]